MNGFPFLRLKKLSIRQAVQLNTIFYTSLFLIMVVLSGLYLYNLQSDRVEEKIEKFRQEAEIKVDVQIQHIQTNLHVLAVDLELLDMMDPKRAADFFSKLIAETLSHNPVQYNGYFALEKELAQKYFHKDGYVLTTHRDPNLAKNPEHHSHKDFIKEIYTDPDYQTNPKEVWYHIAKTAKEVVFSKIYFDNTYMKRWMFSAGHGIYKGDKFQGMVGVDVLLDDLVKELEDIKLGETGGVILVDTRTNQVLTRLQGPPSEFIEVNERFEEPKFNPRRQKNWKELLSGHGHINRFIGDNGKRYVVTAARMESIPWAAIAFQQYQEAYSNVLWQIGVLITVGLLSLLLLINFSREFSDSINKPIEMLIQSLIKNIRSAKRGEIMQVEVGSGDHKEIQRVSRLVNRLVKVINRRLQKQHLMVEEQRLKATQAARMAALGQMAGNVAHEINSPLAAISLHAELLQRELSETSPNSNSLARVKSIRSVAERIAKIISGLRALSRDGKNDPVSEVTVASIIQGTLDICQERFRVANIQLKVDNIPDVSTWCRGVQISQVLLNLLNNSFDAVVSQPVKWVHVTFEETEKEIKISVTDSGKKIPAENAKQMMQPFFTTKDINQGTGLGLSISKRIIEDHHGQLIYDQDSPHTKFVIVLLKA